MKYWLVYNKDNELVGYSSYKQFKDQTSSDELPAKFKEKEDQKQQQREASSLLYKTTNEVLQYLEEAACGLNTTLSGEEFKEMCEDRKKAREKIKDK